MRQSNRLILILLSLFVVLMSLPWLVPHAGILALMGLVPLLCAERIALQTGVRRFWLWYYAAFTVWNLITTWWVCNATVGGGIFASFANALQMAVIFALFRCSRKRLSGALPYIFLAALWISWEYWYLTSAEISWPWLVLGNAFARSTSLIQWYEYTGHMGGSLWVWSVNLALFGVMVALSEGRWQRLTARGRMLLCSALVLLIAAPVATSLVIYGRYQERDDAGHLEVAMAQSSFDPYQKLQELPQAVQNAQVVGLLNDALADRDDDTPVLMMIPETFTSDIILGDVQSSPSWQTFSGLVASHPGSSLMFGAQTYDITATASAPSKLARPYGKGWIESHNSAIMTDATGRKEIYHKSKLVVAVESTPYPSVFIPLDKALSSMMGVSGLMGRCVGQERPSLLHVMDRDTSGVERRKVAVAPVICYESIYGDYCTQYVKLGAQLLAILTNDGWWGDTPGYRQHFSYSRLRAIELRRDIARCANTGISAIIDQKGDVIQQSTWWQPECLRGRVNLSDEQTFYVRNGDIAARISCFVAALLALFCLAETIKKHKK